MTCIASILDGLLSAIDGWTADILNATAADIEAKASEKSRRHS